MATEENTGIIGELKSLLSFKWVLLLFALSAIFWLIGLFWDILTIFQAFAAGTFSASICLAIYLFTTSKIVGKINDYEQIIVQKNISYAIYMFSIALIIVVGYCSALFVFFTLKDLPAN